MKKILLILLCTVLTSCIDNNGKMLSYVSTTETRDSISKLVKNSIKNANNYSDEEMEDVIKQLEQIGKEIYCKKKILTISYSNGKIRSIEGLDSNEIFNGVYY